jgi:RNA polymerase sigma factor (sigma-70 family)
MSAEKNSRKDILDAIRRVLDGEIDAYETIFLAHDPDLRRFISSRYGYAGAAVVNDLALRTHEYAIARLARFDPDRSSFSTWLAWQARHCAGEHIRSGHYKTTLSLDSLQGQGWEPSVAGGEAVYLRGAVTEAVRTAVYSLPDKLRPVAILHRLETRPLSEVAVILGMSKSGVEYRLERADELLRERLAEYRGSCSLDPGGVEWIQTAGEWDGGIERDRGTK